MPVIKTAHEDEIILFMGSRITRGTGKGIVVAVGEQTEQYCCHWVVFNISDSLHSAAK